MKYITLFLLVFPTTLIGQQNGSISLNTPQTFPAPPSISSYNPAYLYLDRLPTPKIRVGLLSAGANPQLMVFEYSQDCKTVPPSVTPVCANLDTDAEVLALIDTLNTINLSTRSLWRRVFDRLIADFPLRFPGGAVVQ